MMAVMRAGCLNYFSTSTYLLTCPALVCFQGHLNALVFPQTTSFKGLSNILNFSRLLEHYPFLKLTGISEQQRKIIKNTFAPVVDSKRMTRWL